MIAAVNSPLEYAAPGPAALSPTPAPFLPPRRRRRRSSSSFACFHLGFRPSELSALSLGRRRMDVLRRVGGWSRISRGDLTAAPVSGGRGKPPEHKPPEHLVIMVNGINGSAADWSYGAKQFAEKHPDKVHVHCSECNYAMLTFDGVDTMGDRLADEVKDVVKNHPNIKKISFVAHSLGGLVARYAIGKLYDNGSCLDNENTNSSSHCLKQPGQVRIAGLEPVNFVTVATPHLGSKGNKQLPFLCGLPFLERRASQTAHFIVGRSGKHLFLTDDDKGEPLLLRMVNDSDDMKFISALRAFKRRVAYANANYDHMVGWRTSSIRRQSELPKSSHLVPDANYQHIVNVEQKHFDGMHNKVPSQVVDAQDEWEEKMIRGLTQVYWERVDVSFQKSRQRFIAHNTIQVKRYWLNSDGADVVYHIIDNFIL